MSGIFGIVNFDGQPVDRAILERMMQYIRHTGPDAQSIWVDPTNPAVAFGNALYRVHNESAHEQQPLTLEGVTITFHGRVDARDDLIGLLKSAGQQVSADSPDVDLVLNAYLVWGRDCLKHLMGDFCFAIWDSHKRQVWAAVDQIGLWPFFYARLGSTLIFANDLTTLRQHPAVSLRLDETAVGDFLIFGTHQTFERNLTIFADIQRLSPAHMLIADAEQTVTQRYWTLPIDPMLRYRTETEYIDHFRDLLKTSVKDRLRTDRAIISLSGGLDSSSIATMARRLTESGEVNTELSAMTSVYDRIHPDTEAYYAGLVARHLNIPQHLFVLDNYLLRPPLPISAEPAVLFLRDLYEDANRIAITRGRVILSGDGGDEILFESPFFDILRGLPLPEAIELFTWQWRFLGHRPAMSGLLPYLRQFPKHLGKQPEASLDEYPPYLQPSFEARLNLKQRWHAFWNWEPVPMNRRQPLAYKYVLRAPYQLGSAAFDGLDFTPPEGACPMLDLRVMRFALSLPPQPWLVNRYLLRQSVGRDLPAEIAKRKKTPLGLIMDHLIQLPGTKWIDEWTPEPEMEAYIRRDAIAPIGEGAADSNTNYLNIRPVALNTWIKRLKQQVGVATLPQP